jgi:hypothetical protein
MTQALAALGAAGPLLVALILISLGIGLPIIIVLAIRFLWDRNVNIGRSRELDKLIWQLHRVASALEQQNALPVSADQPVAERSPARVTAPTPTAAPAAIPAAQTPSTPSAAPVPVAQTPAATPPTIAAPAPGETPKAGVNSMFGF